MTNQRINDIDTITTLSGTDRLLVNTDVVNNVLEQIEKDDFITDIISTDSGNLIEVGTDNKLFVEQTKPVIIKATCATVGVLTGTFSVTNGSSSVAGVSSLLLSECVAGMAIQIAGVSYTIQTVNSDTSLTLTANYSGSSASGLSIYPITKYITITQDLVSGLMLLITMTNASKSNTTAFKINNGTAYTLLDLKGNTSKFNNIAGEKVLIMFNGYNWLLISSDNYSYPDFTAGVTKSYNTEYTTTEEGYIFIGSEIEVFQAAAGTTPSISVTGLIGGTSVYYNYLYFNQNTGAGNWTSRVGSHGIYRIPAGQTYKIYTSSSTGTTSVVSFDLIFYPLRGV